MTDESLRGDCSRCIGLCCVLLAFDRGPLFAFDKGPGEPCRHLDGCDRCAIHDHLADRGLAGCVHYDCLGAGQAVTAMFSGRSWRDGDRTMREMYDAFVRVREANRRLLAQRLKAGR
jgi:hypothetical protein